MSFTHTLTRSWARTGESLSQGIAVVADAEANQDFTIAGSTTNELHALTLDVSQAKAIYILSDQAVTLKTNSSGSPDATINVAANTPILWTNLDPNANPFGTTDVASLYVTNSGTDVANVKIRILVDPTI